MPKVLVTAWRIPLDRIPTRTGGGGFCNMLEESSQHFFLDCIIAQRVWSRCYRWIDILGAQNRGIKNHMENFHLIHLTNK